MQFSLKVLCTSDLRVEVEVPTFNGCGGTLYNVAWWFPFFYILDHCCLKEMRR